MKLGLLFAGQGSQAVGMGKDFYENSSAFRAVFDLLPPAQKKTAFEGPAEELADTRNTQPVMVAFAAGVAAELLPRLEAAGIEPAMAAGLSLGEYSALCVSGVFDPETAVALVSRRAQEMHKAAAGIDCKMSAVMNLDQESLQACCDEASAAGIVQIANLNCPGQIVIAGEAAAVDKAAELALERGARRCVPLPVSGPFHTKFMEPAGKALEKVFAEVSFGSMKFPVLFNAIGREKTDEETVPSLLVRQVSSSVHFEDSIKAMEKAGIDTVIEIGPGKALCGFVRKTSRQIRAWNIESWQDMEKIVSELKGEQS